VVGKIKITNYQALILLELQETDNKSGAWRPELAENLNTATTTLHDNLMRLKTKKLTDRYEENNGMRGRNRVFWYITELGKRAVRVIKNGINNE